MAKSMTVREAAEFLGVSESRIRGLAHEGVIKMTPPVPAMYDTASLTAYKKARDTAAKGKEKKMACGTKSGSKSTKGGKSQKGKK